MNEEEFQVTTVEEACKGDIMLTSTYNIIFTNELACSEVNNLLSKVRKSPYYRQNIKKETKLLLNIYQDFERMMKRVAGPRIYFLSDASQTVEEECGPFVDMMRDSLRKRFEDAGHPESELMGCAETARVMTQLACSNLDYRINEMEKRGINEARLVSYMRMTSVFNQTAYLTDLLYQQTKGGKFLGGVDCSKDFLSLKSIRSIEKRLTDANLIAKAIRTGSELNPTSYSD